MDNPKYRKYKPVQQKYPIINNARKAGTIQKIRNKRIKK
jgi:hypothetical protein